MTLRYNIAGQIYDDVVPCFFICGDMVYDRLNGKWYDLVFIANWAYQNNYTWGPNEYGEVPDDYDLTGINTIPYGPPDPAPALLVATTTMINARSYSVEFTGGPTEEKCYLDFDCEFTNNKPLSANIEFPEGTDDETAAGIIAAIKDTDLYTSRDGNTVFVIGKNKDFLSFTAVIVQGVAGVALEAPVVPVEPPEQSPPIPIPDTPSDVALILNFDDDKRLFALTGGPLSQSKILQIIYTLELTPGHPETRTWAIELPANTRIQLALANALNNPPDEDVKLDRTRSGQFRLRAARMFGSYLVDWSVALLDDAQANTGE